MIVNFSKMHGLGNDFVVIELITQGARLQTAHITKIADRKFGIGCDQVILISPPITPDVDFYYKIFNADGSEVEQCGNGLRCAAKFFKISGLTNKDKVIADCAAGIATVDLDDSQLVTVQWQRNSTAVETQQMHIPDLPNEIHKVSLGNPHGVCIVNDLNATPVADWGAKLTNDPMFPEGANIGFMQIIDRNNIKLRVYERGVGLTHACGSGACAAVIVGNSLNLLDSTVHVQFEYGELVIAYDAQQHSLRMTGPTNIVYIGRFKI
jgi:diaminopimelate epimerase